MTVELACSTPARRKRATAEPAWRKPSESRWAAIPKRCRCGSTFPASTTAGRRVVRLRIKPIPEDKDLSDNQREVDVDIVDRKNRVLLFAGGPSREYQFLRNMLRRSELAKSGETIVDVLLQSAGEGVSQDANQILDRLSAHDARSIAVRHHRGLRSRLARAGSDANRLLEKWVGEESGGLIVIAGPVYTDAWVQTPAMTTIRKLYPVEFNRRLALLEDARYGSQQPWPLDFTREGLEAEFLWLDDDARRQPRSLGFVQRRVRLLPRARTEAGRHGLRHCIPIPKQPSAIRSRFISPGSSTARAACSTWAAAKCGGCGR